MYDMVNMSLCQGRTLVPTYLGPEHGLSGNYRYWEDGQGEGRFYTVMDGPQIHPALASL